MFARSTKAESRAGARAPIGLALTAAAAMLASAVVSAGPALADDTEAHLVAPPALADRAEIATALGSRYQETSAAIGLAQGGSILELFKSPDGRSWTLLATMPDGSSRIFAAGEDWINVTPLPGHRI